MKRKLIVLFFTCLFFFPSFAEIKVSFGNTFSASFDRYGEYVYSFSGRSVRSFLEWQALPLWKIGLNSEIAFDDFSIKASFAYGLPVKCGKMYDSDWTSSGLKTTYSISNNYAIQNYDFSLSLSYKIRFSKVILVPEFTFDYYYDYYQSNDGHGWYGSESYSKSGHEVAWNSPYARHFTKLSRIDLKRNNFFMFMGMGLIIPAGDKFEIGLGTYFAAYAYTYNSDYHRDDAGRNRDFYLNSAQTSSFTRFKEVIYVNFKPFKMFSFDFTSSLLFGDIERGALEGYEQDGGTDILKVNIQLGAKINL